MSGEIPAGGLECGRALGGEQEQLIVAGGAARRRRRRFLEDDVGIGAADAEGADSGAEFGAVVAPVAEAVVDEEGAVLEIDLWIGRLDIADTLGLYTRHRHRLDDHG